MKKITGIYKIQSSIIHDRQYIGSATDIDGRKRTHLNRLRNNTHHSIKLQRHFNKYGENDLKFSVVLECEKDDLIINEQKFINDLNPYFNVCLIAGSTLGTKRSEEAKIKTRETFKNKIYTEEQLRKFSSFKGKKHSEETKKKISLGNKGKKFSQEWRDKMSKRMIGTQRRLGAILS